MTKLEQAARELLDAMKCKSLRVITQKETALREALAEQAEQEPVSWANPHDLERLTIDMKVRACGCPLYTVPLYAAPIHTKDLTDDEIWEALHDKGLMEGIRAVIAADREKNK